MSRTRQRLNIVVSLVVTLVILTSAAYGVFAPRPVLAQSQNLRVMVEPVYNTGLLNVSSSVELGQAFVRVANNAPYWIGLSMDSVPSGLNPRPYDTKTKILSAWELLPPYETLTYVIDFPVGGGQLRISAAAASEKAQLLNSVLPLAGLILGDVALANNWQTLLALMDIPDFLNLARHIKEAGEAIKAGKGDEALRQTMEAATNLGSLLNNSAVRARLVSILVEKGILEGAQTEVALKVATKLGLALPLLFGPIRNSINLIVGVAFGQDQALFLVTALPSDQYTLTTDVSPQGSGSIAVDPQRDNYVRGTRVTLMASPASGYLFDHWTGDAGSTQSNITVAMNSDRKVTAFFTPIRKPDLTVAFLSVPSFVNKGDRVSLDFTIKNIGGSPSGPFVGRIALFGGSSEVALGGFSIRSLATDDSERRVMSVNVPQELPSGKYSLSIFADSSRTVLESNEDNNTVVASLVIGKQESVTLTLYVHENSATGPVIVGAQVTGKDGAGNSFSQVTNSSGYVTITGASGTWSFTASKSGYQTNSWSQSITTTETRHAYLNKPTITDQEKQQEILKIVNIHRGSLPAELVIAIIRQEGGEGAFHISGWNYNSFYREIDGSWAQPTNSDGVMQVTVASGYHERSGPYTDSRDGYERAINDGCDYLLDFYNAYGSYVQATLHYNTGPNSLYIYLGKNWGDRNYLSHVAGHLSSFVPNAYGLSNQNLANLLNEGQGILNDYLYNKGIATGQPVDYYKPYQDQLDKELNKVVQKPNPPTPQSPGSTSEPGSVISTLTPTLQWSGVSGADYYALAISKYPYGSSNIVYNPQQLTGTSYTLPSGVLEPGQKYCWNMQAHNSAGWSDVSSTLYFQTAIAVVTLTLYVHENSATGPVIVGAQVTGKDGAGNSFSQVTNSSGYVTITGASGTWSFTASKTGYQTNSWSQSITATDTKDAYLIKQVMVPTVPQNLRVTGVGSGYVNIAWDSPSSDGGSALTGYRIYRGTSSGGESYYTAISGTTFSNTSVVNGTTYYYKVTAVNAIGESDFSNEVSGTPPVTEEVFSLSAIVVTVNSNNNFLIVKPFNEEKEIKVNLSTYTKLIRLEFPFDPRNPPKEGTFTPIQIPITIDDFEIGDNIFIKTNENIAGKSEFNSVDFIHILPGSKPISKYTLTTSVNPSDGGSISPSGGTYDAGTQLTLTATPASGYRFVSWNGAITSTSNPITITMDENRSITANFEVSTMPPDLTVTSVSFSPSPATVGQSISVTFIVKNQGGSASGSFSNRISLATTQWGTTYSLGNFSMDSLGAGASRTMTVTTDLIPLSVPCPANYYVTVFTDGFQQISESNENNNIGSSTPSMLSISCPQTTLTLYVHENSANGPVIVGAQVTGQDGAGTSFSQVTNSSGYVTITGAPGTWSFTASKSGYDTNSWSQSITATDTKDAYLIKRVTNVTLTLYVHEGSASGPVIVGAQVTGQDGAGASFSQVTNSSGYVTITGAPGTWSFTASKSGYQTNSWSQSITATDTKDAYLPRQVVTLPDLTVTSIVTSISAPYSAKVGDSITVSFAVKNQGGSSSGSFSNRVSLSTSAWGTAYSLGNFSMDSLEAGGLQTGRVSAAIPLISPGYYYVTVFCDALQTIAELDENNNIGSTYPSQIYIESKKSYTLTTSVNPTGSGSVSPAGGSYEEGAQVNLTANPNSGYIFDHWGGDVSGTSPSISIIMNSNKSAIAFFQQANVTLTLYVHENSASGPVIVGAQVTGQDSAGASFSQVTNSSGYITITGVPGTWSFTASKSGYDTNSWSQSITATDTKHAYLVKTTQKPNPPTLVSPGSGSEPGPVLGSLTPTLQWNTVSGADYYALAISKYPYGSSNIIYNPQQLTGTSHTVPGGTLVAGEKYRWNMQAHNSAGWSDVSNSLYFQAPTPTVTYTLTVNLQGQGTVSLSPSGGSYASGTQVTLTATPSSGWQFSGWSGDLSGSQNPATITMNSNKSITTTFTQQATPPPSAPTITSSGSSSEPGPVLSSLTPILQWNAVSGADYYALAISKYPYGSSNIIYNPQQLTGTSHTVPSGTLVAGEKYRWNMQAHNSAGWSAVSNTLYFQTAVPNVTLTLYVHENSASGPVIVGAQVTDQDGAGASFSQTTNSNGYVTITGAPGTWSFTASKSGYDTNSWSQSITATDTKHAYLIKQVVSPQITGVSPSQPKVQATRQWLSILGSGFVSQSQVTLRIGGSTYVVPADRTQFIGSGQINVYVGLTDAGTWSAQVTNPGGYQSNVFSFQVVP